MLKLGSRLQQHVRLVPTQLFDDGDDGDAGDGDGAVGDVVQVGLVSSKEYLSGS